MQDKVGGGVQKYAKHLMDALFNLDKENNYIIFTNSYGASGIPQFSYHNVFEAAFSYPNKILNALILSRRLYLDDLIEKEISRKFGKKIKLDAFWAPNLNFVNLRPETKFLLSVHDISFLIEPEFFTLKERIWHKLVNPKLLFNRANALLPVSCSTAADLDRIGAEKNKVSVIYPGIEQKYFQEISEAELKRVRNKYNLPEKFILTLAAAGKRKNFEGAIKAFQNGNIGKDIKLVIAGFGTGIARASRERIIFLGSVDEDDLAALYKSAQIFIYPSFYEGFGFPPLEAAAVGTPVIAGNATSMPEVCAGSAMLVNPHDANELSSAITALANESARQSYLLNRGQNRVADFSWAESARLLLKSFENLKKPSLFETES